MNFIIIFLPFSKAIQNSNVFEIKYIKLYKKICYGLLFLLVF